MEIDPLQIFCLYMQGLCIGSVLGGVGFTCACERKQYDACRPDIKVLLSLSQEFCCARRLVTVTESPHRDRGINKRRSTTRRMSLSLTSVCAATAEETEYFAKLRFNLQAGLARCRPYWLMGDDAIDQILSEENAIRIIQQYEELSSRVHCMYREDKLRALCPLLAAIPVDGQAELMSLVRRITDAAPAGIALDSEGLNLLRQTFESQRRSMSVAPPKFLRIKEVDAEDHSTSKQSGMPVHRDIESGLVPIYKASSLYSMRPGSAGMMSGIEDYRLLPVKQQ